MHQDELDDREIINSLMNDISENHHILNNLISEVETIDSIQNIENRINHINNDCYRLLEYHTDDMGDIIDHMLDEVLEVYLENADRPFLYTIQENLDSSQIQVGQSQRQDDSSNFFKTTGNRIKQNLSSIYQNF